MSEYNKIVEQYFSGDKTQALRKLNQLIKKNEPFDSIVDRLFKEIVLFRYSKFSPLFVKTKDIDMCLNMLKAICSDAQIDLNFSYFKKSNFFLKVKIIFNLIIQLFWYSKTDYIYELLNRKDLLFRYFSISEPSKALDFLNRKLKIELFVLHSFTSLKRIAVSVWLFLMYMYTAPVVAAIAYKMKLKSEVTDQYSAEINDLSELISVANLPELDNQLKLNQSEVQQLPDELKKDLETP